MEEDRTVEMSEEQTGALVQVVLQLSLIHI